MFLLVWMTLLFAVGSNYANKVASQEETTCSQNGTCIILSEAELTAEAGLCVVIPCYFTIDPDIPLEPTGWHKCDPSKQNCSDSDIMLHLNDTSPNAHTGSRGRVSLLEPDLSYKNCSIIINDLSESDSGSYHFRVNGILTGTGPEYTSSSGVNVTVKSLTQRPTVKIPPLTEGQQTTLTCTAPGLCSGSVPKITWMWGGAGETDSRITGNNTAFKTENLTAVTQRHSSTLTLNPSANYHGANITCKVSFANSISTEKTVTLNVSLKGNTATEKMTTPDMTNRKKSEITGNTNVTEGDVLNLTCSVESFPPSLVTWSKVSSKKNLSSVADTNLQISTGSATLVIPNVTAEHTGQYSCTATHLNETLTMYTSVTVILSPKILKSSRCIHQSEVLTCVCISEGFPLPTIEWPLLKNHTEYSVVTTVSNHTVNSTATVTVKDHSTSVECVSSNKNGEVKENLICKVEPEQKEDEVMKVLRIIMQWEIIIAFSVGAFLSAIICCSARKCHRKKQKEYGNLAETLEMVSSHEVDAGEAVADYQAIDQVADEARGAVAAGKSEVEYSKIDFSLIKMQDPEEAGETQGTTETEYAEIKELNKIKEEAEEDQDEEGEEEMTGEDEEKKNSEPEEKEGEGEGEGEDVALYSSVKKTK